MSREKTYTRRDLFGFALIAAAGYLGNRLYKSYRQPTEEPFSMALEQSRQGELDSIIDQYFPATRDQSIVLYDHAFEKYRQTPSIQSRSPFTTGQSLQVSGEIVLSNQPPRSTIYVTKALWNPQISLTLEDRASHMMRILYRSYLCRNPEKQPWIQSKMEAKFKGETTPAAAMKGAKDSLTIQRELIIPLMSFDYQLGTILEGKPAVSEHVKSLVIENEKQLFDQLQEYDRNTTHPFVRIFVSEALEYLKKRPTYSIIQE